MVMAWAYLLPARGTSFAWCPVLAAGPSGGLLRRGRLGLVATAGIREDGLAGMKRAFGDRYRYG